MNKFRYDRVLIVLGEETNYWMFYQNLVLGKSYCGNGSLSCSFCGCCINKQICRIVKSIWECSKELDFDEDDDSLMEAQ